MYQSWVCLFGLVITLSDFEGATLFVLNYDLVTGVDQSFQKWHQRSLHLHLIWFNFNGLVLGLLG